MVASGKKKIHLLMQKMHETRVRSLGQEDPLEEGMATHSTVLLPGRFYGQGSLVGYTPWGHKELDKIEQLNTHNENLLYSSGNSTDFF